jgi:hypothetical protein
MFDPLNKYFDRLNPYGLPVKYGVIGFIGGVIAVLLMIVFGLSEGNSFHITTPVATGIGGMIGGWIRQRRGKSN